MTGADKRGFSSRWPLILGYLSLLLLVGGFGVWSVTSRLAGAIVASGQIEVDQNRQIVQHPDGGVVDAIEVDEGDTVAAGDILLRLDASQITSELAVVTSQLNETKARRSRLQAERDDADAVAFDPALLEAAETDPAVAELIAGQKRLFDARLSSLKNEVAQLQKRRGQITSQIDGISAQQVALDSQLALIAKELADQQSLLDRGLAQASRVLSLQREEARLLGTLGELAASKAQAEGRITEIEIEILNRTTQRREEAITLLRDILVQELELQERHNTLSERMSRLDIRAPVSGIVYGLQVHAPRAVIRPAEPILYLVPQDRPLVIAARVEPIHVDQVNVGQDVVLRFPNFDARTTPELSGYVDQISADAFVDEGNSMHYYRAEIVMKDGQSDRLPEGAVLIPGMPVEAYLRTEDHTPLAYLVKPLADYFTKAFREN